MIFPSEFWESYLMCRYCRSLFESIAIFSIPHRNDLPSKFRSGWRVSVLAGAISKKIKEQTSPSPCTHSTIPKRNGTSRTVGLAHLLAHDTTHIHCPESRPRVYPRRVG